jgi:hypothetical protein
MSIFIRVAVSMHGSIKRPDRFELSDCIYDVESVEDRWRDKDAEYFKVRTNDGGRYLLRYDPVCGWTVENAFGGGEFHHL